MLRQRKCTTILTNLLINALKYTPDESTISISTRLSEDRTRVRISISDQGPGLKDVDTNNLFVRFTKATTVVPAQESDCPILNTGRTTRRQHWSLRQQEFRKSGSHFLVRTSIKYRTGKYHAAPTRISEYTFGTHARNRKHSRTTGRK